MTIEIKDWTNRSPGDIACINYYLEVIGGTDTPTVESPVGWDQVPVHFVSVRNPNGPREVIWAMWAKILDGTEPEDIHLFVDGEPIPVTPSVVQPPPYKGDNCTTTLHFDRKGIYDPD